jgi:hypothetical protein
MSQQADFVNIILNLAAETFSSKTEETKTKAAKVLIRWLPRKFGAYFCPLSNSKIQQHPS